MEGGVEGERDVWQPRDRVLKGWWAVVAVSCYLVASFAAMPQRPDDITDESLHDALGTLGKRVLVRVRDAAREDEAVRGAVERVARWLLEELASGDMTGTGATEEAPEVSEVPEVPEVPEVLDVPQVPEPPRATVERTLMIGGVAMTVPVEATGDEPLAVVPLLPPKRAERDAAEEDEQAHDDEPMEPPLEGIAARMRLKADGIRWAVERRRLLREKADFDTEIRPNDQMMTRRTHEAPGEPFMWMSDPRPMFPDDAVMDELARVHDAVADAAELAHEATTRDDDHDSPVEMSLRLLAEAQSMLRDALDRAVGKFDTDQLNAYGWLKEQTAARRIYVDRYMRRDDPADPRGVDNLRERIAKIHDAWSSDRAADKAKEERLKKLRYHARRLKDDPGGGEERDWRSMVKTLHEIVEAGDHPPSSKPLRSLLMPLLDRWPADLELAQGAELAVREARLQAERLNAPAEDEAEENEPPRDPAELVEARALLAGRVAVFIGGDERHDARSSLEEALGLRELRWVATSAHQSLKPLETEAMRPEVDLVILAIRWASHAFGDIRHTCEAADKPLVRLPAGYNPAQVAHQVMAQVSEQLKGRPVGAG